MTQQNLRATKPNQTARVLNTLKIPQNKTKSPVFGQSQKVTPECLGLHVVNIIKHINIYDNCKGTISMHERINSERSLKRL